MRIFCAVRHSYNPRSYYGGLWAANFYPALRELGHEVVESRIDLFPASRFMDVPGDFTAEERETRGRLTAQILTEVQHEHKRRPLHLFLSYFYNSHFDPAGFDELRRLGIPSINFYCNSIYQFNLVDAIAAKVDFAWHAERNARDRYLSVGANPVWVQMGADPTLYHPVEGVTRKRSACFVGQRYADRDRWMASLITNEVPVDIYGPGWKETPKKPTKDTSEAGEYLGRFRPAVGSHASHLSTARELMRKQGIFQGLARLLQQWRYRRDSRRLSRLFVSHAHEPIPFEKISEVFAQHDVCLNFSNVWGDGRPGSVLIPHVRLRDFEAPMCRTCYLTGESEEIHEFYEVGKEIDTYSTAEELVDKTSHYLGHSGAAESLRENGYRRALVHHTWRARFNELFRKTGLSTR